MEDILERCLEQATGLTVYSMERPEEVHECIVYTFAEMQHSASDDLEDVTEYDIYLNLYCKSGLNEKKRLIKEALKENGFLKVQIPQANMTDELGLINQAFNYLYVELS